MYQPRDLNGFGVAVGSGAAAMRLAPPLRPLVPAFGARKAKPFGNLDLVVDLGGNIGTASWWRGLATCTSLCVIALSLQPGLGAIAAPAPAPLSDAQWEEAEALAIAPLALGANTGRRMAPVAAVQPLANVPERPTVTLLATLGQSDTLVSALVRSGVGASEAGRAAALIGEAIAPDTIKPGTVLDITLGRRPSAAVARPLEALALRARFDLKLAVRRNGGVLALEKTAIAVDSTPLRIRGEAGDSLYRAARAAGAPAKAVEAYLRAIAAETDVGALHPRDRFDIILESRRASTGESETGRLLYAGLDRATGRSLQMMPWTVGGRVRWFEASGVGKTSGSLLRPVAGPITSQFGYRRHPILGFGRMHKGVDFGGGYGAPVVAVADARVEGAGWSGGYGRQVRLGHGGGIQTSYSHLSSLAVAPGQMVRQGQVIGYVGSTGLSTGPHLHYELYRGGVAINPLSVQFVTRSMLDGAALQAFRARLAGLLATPAGGARAAAD